MQEHFVDNKLLVDIGGPWFVWLLRIFKSFRYDQTGKQAFYKMRPLQVAS